MKKIRIVMAIVAFAPLISVVMILALLMTSGGGEVVTRPLQSPTTVEKAAEYGMIATEMGVPWEVVLLADAFLAKEDGKNGIENVNPMYTSMEFLVLTELCEVWKIARYIYPGDEGYDEAAEKQDAESDENDEASEKQDAGSDENAEEAGVYSRAVDTNIGDESGDNEESEPKPIPVYDWVYHSTEYSVGRGEILSYAGLNESDIDSMSLSDIISKAQERAESRSKHRVIRYTVTVSVNTDLKHVLVELVGIDEKNADGILELSESHYLAQIYFGDMFAFLGEYELPPVVVGNVTRDELANIATSIIGLPYYWGGKSNQYGSPVGALDCSGFVDWVYYQCFGMGVNGVNPPAGVVFNGTAIQYYSSAPITESELRIGDLGFYYDPVMVKDYNHVGIYVGKINGKHAFIHCGGSSFGTPDKPTGRVGVSINSPGTANDYDPINRTTFEPPMPGTNFKFFRRPNFQFVGDVVEQEN